MASEPRGRPSLKRKADDISTDPPSPKKVRFVPTETIDSPPGPIPDCEEWERSTMLCNNVLEYRMKIIKERVAAAAALEYNPTDLAENVALAKEMIMAGIKSAFVRTSAFDEGRESEFGVKFRFDVHPGTTQVLRALFPGIGVSDGRGMDKGWTFNHYSPAEFKHIMGTEMIARVGSSFAELYNWLRVVCLLNEGLIGFSGEYRELTDYPVAWFAKTAAARI